MEPGNFSLLNEREVAFIAEHQNDDPQRLRLKYLSASAGEKDGFIHTNFSMERIKEESSIESFRVELCINAIEARAKIRSKLPHWFARPQLLYVSMLSTQQCSSEATAAYKRSLVQRVVGSKGVAHPSLIGADLTGGMGVDSLFLSSLCSKFLYVERNAELCRATEANFKALAGGFMQDDYSHSADVRFLNSEVSPENIEDILGEGVAAGGEGTYDFIFIDPARRSASDSAKKVVELTEYTPDILSLKDSLLRHSKVVVVKVSPMADIKHLLRQLPQTRQVHIVSVDNDCKEILLLLGDSGLHKRDACGPVADAAGGYSVDDAGDVEVVAVNITATATQTFRYMLGDEKRCKVSAGIPRLSANVPRPADTSNPITSGFSGPNLADRLWQGGFLRLYEPGKSLLKCGAFDLIARRFGLMQLGPSTHLFVDRPDSQLVTGGATSSGVSGNCAIGTSGVAESELSAFQGKLWEIVEVVPFSKRMLRDIARNYPDAGITARNFPLKTNDLLKMTGSKESGVHHIFFTTVGNQTKVIIVVK